MTDIVKGMAAAYHREAWTKHYSEEAMRAALLWLSEHVTDEMIKAALDRPSFKHAISAAIRAAAKNPDDGG
jgi:hypothetical protein